MKKKQGQSSLGRSIIRDRFRHAHQPRNADGSLLHTTDIADPYTRDLRSVTQEGDLDEFLRTAELAGTEFTAGTYYNTPLTYFL